MAQRIESIADGAVSSEVKGYFDLAESRGAPNPVLLRILAHDTNSLETFYDAWNKIFYGGNLDHGLKEIVRVRMARLRGCGY